MKTDDYFVAGILILMVGIICGLGFAIHSDQKQYTAFRKACNNVGGIVMYMDGEKFCVDLKTVLKVE